MTETMNENISQDTIDEIRQNTQNSLSGCGYKPKDDIQPVTLDHREDLSQAP